VTHRLALTFTPRDTPLRASGVVAFGAHARSLARRVLASLEDTFADLEGVVGDDVIVFLGEETTLPFVDGVHYIGEEPGAHSVLVPTTHAPSVPVQWLDALLREQHVTLPVALVPRDEALHVIPLGLARKVDRAVLERFAKGSS
jgi:hypothetical protein